MTVLTVEIKGKKGEKGLKAIKAIIEAFDMEHSISKKAESGKDEPVLITAAEWADIQKRLNTEQFYNDFSESMKSIKDSVNGKKKLKNVKELLNGH